MNAEPPILQTNGPRGLDRAATLRTMDNCTKCGICQTYCPVAAVTDQFPGPKYTGPQAQRFRVIEIAHEMSPSLCSGCGVCTSVCPNDVAITDIITIAKAIMVDHGARLPFAQRLSNRPEILGRLGMVAPPLMNLALRSPALRYVAEVVFGIHRRAPLPQVTGARFRRWLKRHQQLSGIEVGYFSGCAIEYFEPHVGIAVVRTLNRLGYTVTAPARHCCGLPMLSSGELRSARSRAKRTVADLLPTARNGTPIVASSTSCSLAIKAKFATYLGLAKGDAGTVAHAVVDVCEFLREKADGKWTENLRPLPLRVLYHGPCQLRGHGMGMPAAELLSLIPGLAMELSAAVCCGIAGNYGYAREKYDIAMGVGWTLFDQVDKMKPQLVVCDSETCRWHIQAATGVPCVHPIEVILASLDGRDPRQRDFNAPRGRSQSKQ